MKIKPRAGNIKDKGDFTSRVVTYDTGVNLKQWNYVIVVFSLFIIKLGF